MKRLLIFLILVAALSTSASAHDFEADGIYYLKNFDIQDLGGVEGVKADETAKEVEGYYNLNGVRLEEPARGQVTIVRYIDGSSRKIVVK